MASTHGETGEMDPPTHKKQCRFEKYLITVSLGSRDEFLDIVEVAVSKDFLSAEQKIASRGVHDVSDLYPE